MNYLPSKLLKLRKHYNYSQAHIADVLGIDVVEYMAIENGRNVLNYNQCKKIANLYHVGVMDIFKNSDEVTLYEVSKAKTDELNIEYFLPEKSFKDKFVSFIKRNSILVGVTIGVVVLGIIALIMFGGKNDVAYEAILKDVNRLSVSETTVVYISKDGAVKGSGDNTNGQLSNLPSSDVIKVSEGSTFTIVLNNDGSVSGIGLISKYEEELKKWKNIIDIACGDNHVVGVDIKGDVFATGDNTYGQCKVDDFKNISKVYATNNGTILVDENGTLEYCGEFVGSSQIKNFSNILDIDTSSDNLVLLTSDNKVDYVTKSGNFIDIYKWRDIIDVTCGNSFIAGLCKDGTVLIDSEDQDMVKDVSKWTDIIAIDAGDNYLIGFDGSRIYGTGKNNYHQFVQEIVEKNRLPQVSSSSVIVTVGNTVDISFDKVPNAERYEVVLELEEPIVCNVTSNKPISFPTDNLIDGETYRFTITAIGNDEEFLNSIPLEVEFVYTGVKQAEVFVDIEKDFIGMNKDDFVSYLKSIGVLEENIVGIETENECMSNDLTIVSVDGISKGQRINRNELSNVKVTYGYCKINMEASGEVSDE